MKAAIRRQYGKPHVIQIDDQKMPTPKDDEVLVKVVATTVNRTDCANLMAKPSLIMRMVLGIFRPKQMVLGTDFSGIVVGKGANVTSFRLNDRVMGFNDMGAASQAEFLVIPAKNLFSIPEKTTFKQAAASLEGAHYAYTFVKKTSISSGQKVLVNGATGAIGSALLQFLRTCDVEITATCNTKNIDLIHSLGADKIYDYTKEDFTKQEQQYDFIFDAVGKSTFGKCKPILKEKGIYISSELGPNAQNLFYALIPGLTGSRKVIFPVPYQVGETVPFIIKHLEEGTFVPVIDREYELENIKTAYEYVLTGEKTGNVIVNIGE